MPPTVSSNTQKLLDSMMKDAGVSAYQQRKLKAVAEGKQPIVDRSVGHAARRKANPVQYEDPLRGVPLNPRFVPGGRKTHQEIRVETNGYERDMFRGGGPQPVDRSAEKAKLQDSYLKDEKGNIPVRGLSKKPTRPNEKISEEAALHKAISEEILERQQFVEEMLALGRKEQAETVRGQITERLVELRRLEQLMKE